MTVRSVGPRVSRSLATSSRAEMVSAGSTARSSWEGLVFREVRPAEFRAPTLGAQLVDAGGYGDAGDPIREGHLALVLVEAAKHFEKNILDEVFLGSAAWAVGADDAQHHGAEVFDEGAAGILIVEADFFETSGDVEDFVGHGRGRWAGEESAARLPTAHAERGCRCYLPVLAEFTRPALHRTWPRGGTVDR